MEEGRNEQYKVIIATVFGVVLANLALVLRFLSRKIANIALKPDDYLMALAVLFHWGIAMAGVVLLQHGLGLPLSQTSPSSLVVYAKILYTGTFLYTLTINFTKLSILYVYKRTFINKSMQIQVYIVSGIVVGWTIVCCTAGALICHPVEKVWNPMVPGSCIDQAKFFYGIQVPNIATDFIIIVMPVHSVIKLPLSKPQKWSLVAIFGIGVMTFVFDVIRLIVMIRLSNSSEDITLAQAEPAVWTCIEPAVGILAGCLTNMRPLLHLFRHGRARSTGTGASDETGESGLSRSPWGSERSERSGDESVFDSIMKGKGKTARVTTPNSQRDTGPDTEVEMGVALGWGSQERRVVSWTE